MSAPAVLLVAVALSIQPPPSVPDSFDAAAAATTAAAPSCASGETSAPVYSPPAYQVEPDSSVPPGIAAAAEAAWNSTSCNPNDTGFPLLTPAAVSGAKPVSVSVVGGLNPRNNSSCGQTVPSGPSSYSIILYMQARGQSGSIGSCGSTAAMTQSLEHEFGHLLNLADSTCPGYIMGPVAFPPQTGSIPPQPNPRSIQPAECAMANQMNITPAEQPPPQPPPNQCPPNCSCPATCEYGCDVNGVCLGNPCDTDPTGPGCGPCETDPTCGGGGGDGGGCDAEHPCDDGGIQAPPPPAAPRNARPVRRLFC